jgi:hypothetical protein
MAKKAKRGRPAGSGKKKKEEAKAVPGFWRGFGAVSLIILGVVLAFGAFISAPIPHNLWHGFWWTFGAAAVIAPIVLVYLGGLKFLSEDQRIPFHKILGASALMIFLASWLHTAFLHNSADALSMVGGHGGNVGKGIGDAMAGALGKFLSSLIFLILTVFAVLFTFGVEPKSLLKVLDPFKRAGRPPASAWKRRSPASGGRYRSAQRQSGHRPPGQPVQLQEWNELSSKPLGFVIGKDIAGKVHHRRPGQDAAPCWSPARPVPVSRL